MASSRVMPIGTRTTTHDVDGLDPDSYTAHRLKHASPEHLHLTSRRFFIGPIPEGWLNSNRKSWYRRRVELSTYSSKKSRFDAVAGTGTGTGTGTATRTASRRRTLTGLDGPSTAARMTYSFPRPPDAVDETSDPSAAATDEDDSDEEEHQARNIEPVATHDLARLLDQARAQHEDTAAETEDEEEGSAPPRRGVPIAASRDLDGARDPVREARDARGLSTGGESFQTAQQTIEGPSKTSTPIQALHRPARDSDPDSQVASLPTTNRLSLQPSQGTQESLDTNSRTGLLSAPAHDPTAKSLAYHDPAPIRDERPYQVERAGTGTGVRFKVAQEVHKGRFRMANKAVRARDRVVNKKLRRDTLREGTVVKMERMLVRCDITLQPVPEDFDENESIKVETRILKKWREYMVVARKSKKQDRDDFRLQIYQTRVIPEIDDESTKKKPKHEVRLDPKTTRVNLYSSLDKTVVIWHPYKKGTRIFVMRPSSTAHSVEWYTFLRDALGWQRPANLHVHVPDLDVVLKLDKPFAGLEAATVDARDNETALAQTVAAEKAVAGKIIAQCIAMLEKDPEWASVMATWKETAKMGLAWKRYDRLEWVYGANDQKMYGSMAMQRSHDLELRPKEHYPTATYGRKGKRHQEPAPVEGFLVRLTSQKGVHQRFGKAFFKRLYFSTHNQFLMFNRPAKTVPPHPPRLATLGDRDEVPSSHDIVEQTPLMFDIDPYKLSDQDISWLASGDRASRHLHDRAAVEEARRNVANVVDADGYINMCYIRKVRVIHWGASPAEEHLEAGSSSDVDFHQDVSDTRREDGTTREIDDDRVFELVLDNGLVVRLQAFSSQTRDEWIRRLRSLVKYWKLRMAAEMDTYKAIRQSNLKELNIDEELEAIVGQFAKKWEVSRSQASPELYNMCGISSCRSITMAGPLYLKTRRRAAFHRSQVILCGGKLLIYQGSVRKSSGVQVRHIHQERQQVVDLKDCYVYSGLIVDDDLLYHNKTFDANHPGMASLPRVYLEDGWTSADVDVMTCFVVWMNRRKGWFRTGGSDDDPARSNQDNPTRGSTRSKLRRVRQLGVPGRGMVFKCRSRAERDHWVLSVASEIERVVEQEADEMGIEGEFRFDT